MGANALLSNALVSSSKDARRRYAPLLEGVGLGSNIAQQILTKLSVLQYEQQHEIAPWYNLWREHCDQYFDLETAEQILSSDVPCAAGTRLFLAQSYCKIVLLEALQLALGHDQYNPSRRSLYDWIDIVTDTELTDLRDALRRELTEIANFQHLNAVEISDFFATLYQELLPPALRHLLGEYYTPSWLVEHCIGLVEQFAPSDDGSLTVMDPAAGSGSFLAHYVAHVSASGSASSIKLIGFDVNPLAVDFCFANIAFAISTATRLSGRPTFKVNVHLVDGVVDPLAGGDGPLFQSSAKAQKKVLGTSFAKGVISDRSVSGLVDQFKISARGQDAFSETLKQYIHDLFVATEPASAHVIVGNPPWITWDGLTQRYRDRVAPQWSSSALVTNTGWKAKVAAGKTDFSSLFVYRAAERHANRNAVMVFVLPLSLFQSRLAGAGFRKFTTSGGRTFPLVQLDDFSEVKVFSDAVNRTAVGAFVLDRASAYPIPYMTWDKTIGKEQQRHCTPTLAGPLDPAEVTSPIVAFDRGFDKLQTIVGKSDYRARGGVNTGGANTILWLEVLDQTDSYYRIRNVGKSRRSDNPVIVGEVERGAVRSLLGGTDMRRWKAVPSKSILLLYSSEQPKKAMPVSAVKDIYPRAYEYVSKFQTELEGRKEYHRWGCSGPFYEVYRIGPYTFSPIKVVWQHTGYRKALNVSVIDDRERPTTIPDQKVILIPSESLEEAHYICAFLASSSTAGLLDRYLGTDASTHILDYIALRRFIPQNPDHRRLADLSLAAHNAAAEDVSVTYFENEIDEVVASLLRRS
jgi:methylase of polypeptide subunit release factors